MKVWDKQNAIQGLKIMDYLTAGITSVAVILNTGEVKQKFVV